MQNYEIISREELSTVKKRKANNAVRDNQKDFKRQDKRIQYIKANRLNNSVYKNK